MLRIGVRNCDKILAKCHENSHYAFLLRFRPSGVYRLFPSVGFTAFGVQFFRKRNTFFSL